MRIRAGRDLNKVICFALMVMMLFSLASCAFIGGKDGELKPIITPTPTVPIAPTPTPTATNTTETPKESDAPSINIPGGFSIDDESDAMFAIVLGVPSGIGEPTRVIDDELTEEYGINYSFCVIPLRDNMHISIESINPDDMHFRESPLYTVIDEFSASLGEYYLINSFAEEESYISVYTRIVAQDGSSQGVFLVDPTEHGKDGEFIISPDKTPDRLNDSKLRIISTMAAGAIWQYGEELGLTNEWGEVLSSDVITPEQLALSKSACRNWIHSVISMIDYGSFNAEDPNYSNRAAQYAEIIFPDVKLNELPQTDSLTDRGEEIFTMVGNRQIFPAFASADGKTGYIIIGISNDDDDEPDDFFRVDWEAIEPFDVYRLFQYRLVGVKPMQRIIMGGRPYDEFYEKYLGPESVSALEKLGFNYSPGWLDRQGVWVTGSTWLLRDLGDLGSGSGKRSETYILLDDDEENITYLGAYSPFYYESETQAEEDWSDLGIVKIPSSWDYEVQIHNDLTIIGESAHGSFNMWVGYSMIDSIESELERSNSYEEFVFDDGHVGYMLFFDDLVSWLREDWMTLHLYDFYDENVFENNKDIAMKIARSLTTE